ncbi:hypothetical protein HER21_28695 [Pseudomonas sp. BGM005]|nr:hypothetical protein [Pseudomonas sp. BG5]
MLNTPQQRLLSELRQAWERELATLLYLRPGLDVEAAAKWSVTEAAGRLDCRPLEVLQQLTDLLMRDALLPWEFGPPKPAPVGLLNAFSKP